ncbi:MAG: 3-hydroxyacyl-ACP dehydratase FabZ [Nitrospinota bacterium]
MDISEIQKILPHRYPFLLIDKVLEIVPEKSITAVKNVTINEPFFQGHYPGQPIMPGVLIIEAMAQAAAVLAIKSVEDRPGKKTPLFAGIEKARFKRPVLPGDVLTIEISVTKVRSMIWWLSGKASVDGKLACRAEIQAALAIEE